MPTTVKKAPLEEIFTQLAQLESEAARRRFLSRHKSLARPAVVRQLSDLVLEKIRVNTREALPQDWARTQNNLGNALSEQAAASEGADRARLLSEAVSACRSALASQWCRTTRRAC